MIPENATVIKAELSFYVISGLKSYYNLKNGPKGLYQITTDWDESTVTYKNAPKYSNTAIAKNTENSVQVWENFNVTSVITEIVENESPDYGFLLQMTSRNYGIVIASSENSNEDNRPKLSITYDEPTGVNNSTNFNLPVSNEYKITIMDIKGREIASCHTSSLASIDHLRKSLSSGIHIVTIKTPDNRLIKKFQYIH